MRQRSGWYVGGWTCPVSVDSLIYPSSDGVRFLESSGPKEDSDALPLLLDPALGGGEVEGLLGAQPGELTAVDPLCFSQL
jgi:hypothetical protein